MRKTILKFATVSLTMLAAAGLLACSEAGPSEKAGQKVDEMVEKMKHGDEGALEKAGRKVDEAFDDASEAMKKD